MLVAFEDWLVERDGAQKSSFEKKTEFGEIRIQEIGVQNILPESTLPNYFHNSFMGIAPVYRLRLHVL